jgi:hypothetical protein
VLPGAAKLSEQKLRDAARRCPVEAIRLLDDTGNDVTDEAA